jgi:cytochrome P450
MPIVSEPGSPEARQARLDEEFFFEHLNVYDERWANQMMDVVPELVSRCPVTHSDALGGFWVVSSYEDVAAGFQNWRDLSSRLEKALAPLRPGQPTKPPIDLDPPLQRRFRQLLNPFLTPERVAEHEPWIRALVTELIDNFVEDGQCDVAGKFARALPGRMLFRILFGIDDADVPMVQSWVRQVLYHPSAPESIPVEKKWIAWIYQIMEQRRGSPRQDDIIDALLHSTIEGEPIPDDVIMGTMNVLMQGGFGTTADAIGTAMMLLGRDQALQAELREDPSLIPSAVEEFLRYEPSVSGMTRYCVRDTTIGGREIKSGDRIFLMITGANHDPQEFPNPEQIDIRRDPNRHLSFGLGNHRCIGSNVARLNLRVSLEELLARLSPFHLTTGEEIRRDPSSAWGPAYLHLTFNPGQRRTPGMSRP